MLYSDYEPYIDERQNFFRKEIETKRNDALAKLALLCPNLKFLEHFATILSYAHKEELVAAEKIADHLNLSEADFLAIDENLQGFTVEFENFWWS